MKADRQAPIGVFDSGVGGLTVVREIMRNLPDERIVYFGDTARVPYGSKSKNTVIRYSRQIVHFLETQQVKAIVIACNTASALALDTIEKEIDLPIIGVVKPGAQMAVETTQNKRVGVIATESTIQSGLYQQLITEADPAITVYGKPCPLFVPLVEEGWTKDPITEEVARRYLAEILDKDIDTLIMGCTHYPLLRSLLRKVVGEKVTLVNPAYETSQALSWRIRETMSWAVRNTSSSQATAWSGSMPSHIPFCRSRSAIRNRYRLKTIKNDIQKRERNIRKGWKKTYSSASADCSI
mgnify:CR=1 FL=1